MNVYDNEFYPEVYLDECLYVKDNTGYIKSFFSGGLFFPNRI